LDITKLRTIPCVRMPGLPEVPAAEHMDIDANGVISGLS
jgi:formyltetrahydrofolate synthetase